MKGDSSSKRDGASDLEVGSRFILLELRRMNPLHQSFQTMVGKILIGLLLLAPGQLSLARPPAPKNETNKKFVEEFLKEIQVPELLFCPRDQVVFKSEAMPEFDAKILASYPVSSAEQSKLKPAVVRARSLLWALSGQQPPADLADAVKSMRTENPFDFTVLRDRYAVPANVNQFKQELFKESRTHAALLQFLVDGLEELQLNSKDRDAEPSRWRAHYDFIEARLKLQITQVYEYQSMIGLMRKELPEYDPKVHTGWKLVAIPKIQGDFEGKRLAKEALQSLGAMTTREAGTPWAVLGLRLKGVPIGLEWRATK
jgi:hypothetical protein